MISSYDVRVFKLEVNKGTRRTTYTVRWQVGRKRHRDTFKTKALAESFRSNLTAAARRGEAFDVDSGLSVSMARVQAQRSWHEFAIAHVDAKWSRLAAKSRKSTAESLSVITLAMAKGERGRPDDALLRRALREFAFNTTRRGAADCPDEVRQALRWLEDHSRPVGDLADPAVIRAVLDAIAVRLDGKPAAATVVNRRRATLRNAIGYAMEQGLLTANPMDAVQWKAPRATRAIDRRSVVNPMQGRTLLEGVRRTPRTGPQLMAFFAVMYHAALRPEEAVNLRKHWLSLPAEGWGMLHLERATPDVGSSWTDSGERYDDRQLKHRPVGEVRSVPTSPELTAILHEHVDLFGVSADGRLFVGERGGPLARITYARMWDRARRAVFSDAAYASPLARRPYDLRHAAVSTWLSAGVPPATVADWAGHSVEVLHAVYAKCLDGDRQLGERLVQDRMGWRPPEKSARIQHSGPDSAGSNR